MRFPSAATALAYSPAFLFGALVAGGGLPVLRHDWFTVSGRFSLLEFTLSTLAWQPAGIGSARVYPTDYLFAIANTLLALILGTHLGSIVYAALVGALCIYGARALMSLERNEPWPLFAFGLFALFNPWVYVKVVAGHLAMIAAYGALMALIAELWRPKPRWLVTAFLMGPMAQLQFFVLGMGASIVAAAIRRDRGAIAPIAAGVVFALPSILGFAVNLRSVADTPYNIDWQANQSIAPVDAIALNGYFTHYADALGQIAFDAVWSFVAISVIGIVAGPGRRSIVLCGVGIAAWALSTGTKGPLGSSYSFLVEHFPPIELYRELYDLLAVVATTYIVTAAVATSRFVALGRLAVIPGLMLVASWIAAPPNRFWVYRSELPPLRVDAPPNTRIALYPDIDPLHFENRGSGTDPDAYARPNNVTSLNESEFAYPASVALRSYAHTGDPSLLRALAVSRIYGRPWLQPDRNAASEASAVSSQFVGSVTDGVKFVAGAPELCLLDAISMSRSVPKLGSGQIFFGDVAGVSGQETIPRAWSHYAKVAPIAPLRGRLRASDDWVDVRSAFRAQPELGQALGGALTTSTAAFQLAGMPRELLVDVRGSLISNDGTVMARSTRGYQWILVPAHSISVRCAGECVVAARGDPPMLGNPPVPISTVLPLHAPAPWIAWTIVAPRRSETVMKYLVGYDRAMLAFSPTGALAHVRIETVFNGWLIPSHARDFPIVIVDVVSAGQFALEIVGFGLFVGLTWRLVRVNALLPSALRPPRSAQ